MSEYNNSRVFLVGFSSKVMIETARQLKGKGVDIAYWVLNLDLGQAKQVRKEDFPKTIFHHELEAVKAMPAPSVETSMFEPVSRDILIKLFECESETLGMMDRIDYSKAHYQKKRHFYFKYIAYWNGVLEQFKPTAIVFSTYPHLAYDFVLYHLAKLKQIPTLMFEISSIPGRLLLQRSIQGENSALLAQMSESQGNIKLENLPENLQRFYLKMTRQDKSYLFYDPIYVRKANYSPLLPYKPDFKSQIKKIRQGNFLRIFSGPIQYIKKFKKFYNKSFHLSTLDYDFKGFARIKKIRQWEKTKQQFKAEYNQLAKTLDLNKKFVFLALSSQPERSTSPMGGVFSHQLLAVDMLSSAVPSDWLVYVKEHPVQWAEGGVHNQQGRYPGYYQEIVRHQNVRLAPIEMSTEQLSLKSQAVATVAGTTGWQALFKSKPVLVFGYPVYRSCEGAFHVGSLEECRQALAIIENGYKVDKQKVLNFLAALDKVSVKGYLASRGLKDVSMPITNCAKNLAKAIIKVI